MSWGWNGDLGWEGGGRGASASRLVVVPDNVRRRRLRVEVPIPVARRHGRVPLVARRELDRAVLRARRGRRVPPARGVQVDQHNDERVQDERDAACVRA